MCGIAGIAGRPASITRPLVAHMCGRMRHRGPDAEGTFAVEDIALGHRRLKILDLTASGSQPMISADGSVALVFNGEIYNFSTLRQELQAIGCRFRGTSDTEVLLHGYLEWGSDVVQKLAGMYAFAVYDSRCKELFLARDPLGIKPLYLWQQGRLLVFGSELRALMASGLVDATVDEVAIAQTLLSESPFGERTCWKHVRSLRPGHWLRWANGSTSEGRFWSFPNGQASFHEEQFADQVNKVVREHLTSDVPLGVLLSGGVDSSVLTALACRQSSGTVKTFTLTFPGTAVDEGEHARSVAERLGTEHHEIPIRVEDLQANLDPFLAASDFPSADGLNVYTVCKHVREAGITVLLSGQGGDEAFAGYANFRRLPKLEGLLSRWRLLPKPLRRLGRFAGCWAGDFGGRAKLACLLDSSDTMADTYLVLRSLIPPRLLRQLLADDLWRALECSWREQVQEWREEIPMLDDVGEVARMESRFYLHNTLLRVSDVYSMANSLELRVPFVDSRICELANRAPKAARIQQGIPKPLLLNLARNQLPPACWQRRKCGFHLPVGEWLLGPLRERARRVFHETVLGDSHLFQTSQWQRLWKQLEQDPTYLPVANAVWTCVVIGEWWQRNMAVTHVKAT